MYVIFGEPFVFRAWIRSLWWTGGASLLIGAVVGIWRDLLPPLYVCETEFVPPSLFHISAHPPQIVPASSEDMERFHSYLRSPSLWQAMADSLRLVEHYELSRIQSPAKREKALWKILRNSISVRITRNATLFLSVTDRDPRYAYLMVQFLMDRIRQEISKLSGEKIALTNPTPQEREAEERIQSISERLSYLRKRYGILTGFHTTGLPLRADFIRIAQSPEALAHYDEVLSLELDLAYWTEMKAHFRRRRMERAHILAARPDKLWLLTYPSLPTLPRNRYPLLWGFLSGLLTFTLLSMLSLYVHLYLSRRRKAILATHSSFVESLIPYE